LKKDLSREKRQPFSKSLFIGEARAIRAKPTVTFVTKGEGK
jgi:hypothetical protein